MENTIENNRLIAEFMGVEFNNDKDKCNHPLIAAPWPPIECLKYHVSWNWLMPVVEKIARTPFEEEDATAYARTFGMLNDEGKIMVRLNRFQLHVADTLIEAAYAAVLEYINWYNSNQPPTINQ